MPHTSMLMAHIENALNLKYKIGTIVYISSGDVRLHTLWGPLPTQFVGTIIYTICGDIYSHNL